MSYYLSRTLCDVLREMRELTKTLNFGAIPGLIEEAQTMGNRMEAKLGDIHNHEQLLKDIKKLREEKKKLKEELGKD